MSAVEILRMARESGVHIGIEGADLILDAEREPTSRVLEAIRRHKAGIVDLLTEADGDRTADGWRVFYDECAAKAEFNGSQSREEAEARAFECCIVEWLNQHPEPSDPGHCAWCAAAETSDACVVPYGANQGGHAWLHPACWQPWHDERRQSAIAALAAFNIDEPRKERS